MSSQDNTPKCPQTHPKARATCLISALVWFGLILCAPLFGLESDFRDEIPMGRKWIYGCLLMTFVSMALWAWLRIKADAAIKNTKWVRRDGQMLP